jgi:hypothetical protein
MSRMSGYLRGLPKVIETDNLNMNFLNNVSGYFIEITNIKTTINRSFPLQSIKRDGIRNFINDFKPEEKIVVDKIALEDFIKYQEATFNIVRGYYFNEGHNININEKINYCFNERLKKKKDKNPIEIVYKLLMNAAYGKTIEKEHKEDLKFINTKKEFKNMYDYHFNSVISYDKITEDKYCMKVRKSINKHYSRPQIGVEILSMSKRIMNEVMCLAEDENLDIYYQDTDSIHIKDSNIEILSNKFKEKYNRTLIGKYMGQFHSDFPDDAKAIECIFLGKKSYIDVLQKPNKNGEYKIDKNLQDYHIRMKGVPKESIIKHKSNNKPIDIYKDLFNGKSYKFDCLLGCLGFKKNNDFSTKSLTEFLRELSF